MAKKSNLPFKKKLKARKIHFALSYFAAIILGLMIITGVLLNHSDLFKLDKIKIQQPWLLQWYGYEMPTIIQAFPIENNWLTEINQPGEPTPKLYWNQTPLNITTSTHDSLQEVINLSQFILLLQSQHLTLLTHNGEWIESIALPDTLKTHPSLKQTKPQFITTPSQRILLLKNHQAWLLSDDLNALMLVNFPETTKPLLDTKADRLPSQQADALFAQYDSPLSLEKIILELHSGYFFGKVGPFLLDVFALLLLVMIISGIRLHHDKKNKR